MLKQLSVPKKAFGAITFLSVICYVGVMVYVQQASANHSTEHWIRYHAMVDNITRSGNKFVVTTIHKLRYHNHHNHVYLSTEHGEKQLRTGNQWEDVTLGTLNPLLTEEKDVDIRMASGYGTFTVTRSEQWGWTAESSYEASAYTNLKTSDGWDNDSLVFDQIEAFTGEFSTDAFGPGIPPLPTADPAQISSHPNN